MRLTLLTISTILLIACIYTLYNMKPTEMDVIFDENTKELLNIDTCIYDLDSIEEYDRMVMDSLDSMDVRIFDLDSMERRMLYDEEYERMVRDSLDKMSDDWTGTTQEDSI